MRSASVYGKDTLVHRASGTAFTGSMRPSAGVLLGLSGLFCSGNLVLAELIDLTLILPSMSIVSFHLVPIRPDW